MLLLNPTTAMPLMLLLNPTTARKCAHKIAPLPRNDHDSATSPIDFHALSNGDRSLSVLSEHLRSQRNRNVYPDEVLDDAVALV